MAYKRAVGMCGGHSVSVCLKTSGGKNRSYKRSLCTCLVDSRETLLKVAAKVVFEQLVAHRRHEHSQPSARAWCMREVVYN